MTKYTVLVADKSGYWKVAIENLEAHSATGAVRAWIADVMKQGATEVAAAYVAVPAKSWQPTKATVETQTRIRIGGTA